MTSNSCNRRDVLKSGLQLAATTAASTFIPRASAQAPAPEPLADPTLRLITTTESQPWQTGALYKPGFSWDMLNLNIDPAQLLPNTQPIQGFGACFNELGWTSLQQLSAADRDAVLRELFDPSAGARLNYCRTPIGANDFSTGPYSYDETDGDFNLDHFSIAHDEQTLIPFIQAAQQHQPKLRLWASPWTPPSWMKRNHFYAEAKAFPGLKDNGIRPDQIGREGEDMFLQEPRYFEAYARYFGAYIDACRKRGIPVGMVMPQNEFNSAQSFPSCTWTPEGLTEFLHYLGPEMADRDVLIFFGTLERGNPRLLETVMTDPDGRRYIKGIGVQWAGKNALPALHQEFPSLPIFQSEQECGDGRNTWEYTSYGWQLMKHYFRSGASAWMYWNISLFEGGRSTWGWAQNSLLTIDPAVKTYRWNHDYYLLRHLTHFVETGARPLIATGTCDDALAFLNPDNSVVILIRNEPAHEQRIQIQTGPRQTMAILPPNSIATVVLPPPQHT